MIGFDIDPAIAVGLGALLGLIVHAPRLRPLAKVIPTGAFALLAFAMLEALPVPAPLLYAAVGAGFVVSVIRLFGGK